MALVTHNAKFKRRLRHFEHRFLAYQANRALVRYERWHRLEGLLSQTWQSWCYFCREVLIDSCLGTVAFGGRVVPRAQPSWTTEERVSYEVLCASRKSLPKVGVTLASQRQEITWGDVSKLVGVIGTLRPSNKSELLSGFGSGLIGPAHLQIVRNAAAHLNSENRADVYRLMAFYFGSSMLHPTDLAEWTAISTKNPAYIDWLDDMRTMADACIQ